MITKLTTEEKLAGYLFELQRAFQATHSMYHHDGKSFMVNGEIYLPPRVFIECQVSTCINNLRLYDLLIEISGLSPRVIQ